MNVVNYSPNTRLDAENIYGILPEKNKNKCKQTKSGKMPKDTLVNAGVFGSSGESESAEIAR